MVQVGLEKGTESSMETDWLLGEEESSGMCIELDGGLKKEMSLS